MLEQFLETNNIEDLKNYGINIVYHPDLPLCIANYDQIKSLDYKFHPLVKQSRGTVIDTQTRKIIAKGPDRFFHINETPDFDWKEFDCYEKIDGSFILVYYYDGWRVNTRGTFGTGNTPFGNETWNQLVQKHLKFDLDPKVSYVFELVGPYNKVVLPYESGLYLLCGFNPEELSDDELDYAARLNGVNRPKKYSFCQEDIFKIIQDSKDIEGFVLKDKIQRVKAKTLHYLALHRFLNNGNIASLDSFIKFYPDELGELYEFNQFKNIFDSYKYGLDLLVKEIQKDWLCYKDISDQKEFAFAINHLPWKSVLFSLRKGYSLWDALKLVKTPGQTTPLAKLYISFAESRGLESPL
jgi:hypothetical protein